MMTKSHEVDYACSLHVYVLLTDVIDGLFLKDSEIIRLYCPFYHRMYNHSLASTPSRRVLRLQLIIPFQGRILPLPSSSFSSAYAPGNDC
jgi:hypothetical protein